MYNSVRKLFKVYNMSNLDLQNIADSKIVILPVGSLEQHGNHLPVSTDSIIAQYLAENVAEKIDAVSLPVLTFGISFEHEPMFNVSLAHQTFSLVI
ncbi:MAG: creatininase family protein, partial [Nitrososphaeraceae archaeon]|nr:creatininase family protein [Nitrososphaeraceae archaeon]